MDNEIQISATASSWLLIQELLHMAMDSSLHLSCEDSGMIAKAVAELSTAIDGVIGHEIR